jgi:hypothetical protein
VTNAYVTDADQRIVSGATTAIYLDCNRTDTYTANGSPDRPFKTLAESIAYVTTQNMAGVAYYATGEYPTAGGTATLPDVPIVIHGNRSSITGSSTFNIPGTYTAKNLDLVGNVNFTSGSGAHFVTLEGQTIDGSVSVDSGVTIYLNNVHITGNYTKAAGSVTYKGFGTTIDGNITGTGTVIEATQVNTDALTTSTVVIVDSLGSLASSITTSTELTYIHGVTSAIQTQLDGKQPLDADLTALAALTGEGYSFRYTDGTWALLTGSSSVSWGAITGTLADQTDLQNALNAKQPWTPI